ncbi:MAG: hypothetical protein N3C12_10925 [Candidatus Binatia bacterium]|nr:hypothetical protein [Candidatus Binatia bacterium]
MERVLVLVDDNVNARVVCEVLLDSRGETCRTCGCDHLRDCCFLFQHGRVVLLDVKLEDEAARDNLHDAIQDLIRAAADPIRVVVVTEETSRLVRSGLSEVADVVLHPANVGAQLLTKLDNLQNQRSAWPFTNQVFTPTEGRSRAT